MALLDLIHPTGKNACMSLDNPTRRTLLAGSTLSLLATQSASAARNVAGPAPLVPDGSLSAKDFGAIGDGQRHPLAERFASLADARRVFPFAGSLDQTLDWAGIQAAVNAVEGQLDRRVYVPAGRYIISNSIRLPSAIDLHGDGAGITLLDNQIFPLKEPQLVNAATSFVGVVIRAMSLYGGTHALKVDVPNGEIAWLFMDGVSCALQTDKNIECDKLLQASNFNNCGFSASPYGVFVAGHTTNAVNFHNCNFEAHSQASLHLSGAEGVNVHGGKFEAGGRLPNPSGAERVTIFLENAGAVNFHGVYFEATHEILLKDVRSRGGVSFEGCHFTGADVGKGLIPYRFVSDGLVTFGSNDWYLPSEGPARILMTGYNGQKLAAEGGGTEILSRSPRQQRSVSGTRAVPPSGTLPIISVTRIGTAVPLLLTGELILQGIVQLRTGGTALVSRRYHVRLAATGEAPLSGRAEIVSALDDPGVDLAVRLQPLAGQDGTVEVVLRSAVGATLQWSFESLSTVGANGARLESEVPPAG